MAEYDPPPHTGEGNPTPLWTSVSSDERLFALFAHLGTIISSFLIPLIIWIVKKDDSKFVDHHGKEALNFQITIFLGYIVGGILAILVVGLFIILACWILSLVCAVMAAVKANEGKEYRYPLSWRIIK
ncbi:MAG TPA: DUF4870 domain-containing protein [Anseongella sp.]|nr:DUF4870 domain-containing protein [Anseongella sp.]